MPLLKIYYSEASAALFTTNTHLNNTAEVRTFIRWISIHSDLCTEMIFIKHVNSGVSLFCQCFASPHISNNQPSPVLLLWPTLRFAKGQQTQGGGVGITRDLPKVRNTNRTADSLMKAKG